MNVTDIFRDWQRLAGDLAAKPWGRDEIFGFFQRFRPTGDGLEDALLPLPQGRAILDRIRPVFLVTSDGWQNAESFDAYFIVRKPAPIDPATAEALVRSHLTNVAEIASSANVVELVDLLREPTLSISHESPPQTQGPHDTDTFIDDTLCNWEGSLSPDPAGITGLQEAFYSIACDYNVARHLMWPWFAKSTDLQEPFLPYFNLWLHGVTYRFVGPSTATVFIPTRA
jgi:hypothetical protein